MLVYQTQTAVLPRKAFDRLRFWCECWLHDPRTTCKHFVRLNKDSSVTDKAPRLESTSKWWAKETFTNDSVCSTVQQRYHSLAISLESKDNHETFCSYRKSPDITSEHLPPSPQYKKSLVLSNLPEKNKDKYLESVLKNTKERTLTVMRLKKLKMFQRTDERACTTASFMILMKNEV